MTVIIDAIKMCEENVSELKKNVNHIKDYLGQRPPFLIINASDDKGNERYIKNKVTDGEDIGLRPMVRKFDEDCTEAQIIDLIEYCNERCIPVLLQEPTYPHIDSKMLMEYIEPHVDADGFTSQRMGELALGKANVYSATPKGVMNLLDFHDVDIEGKNALVIGRSNHVGKPMSMALINRGATAITANSKTENLSNLVRQSDIVISCVGKLGVVRSEDIKSGAVVIGVGFTYVEGKQLLDFDVHDVSKHSGALLVSNRISCTGKATINALLQNVVELYMENYNEGRLHFVELR